MENKEKYLHDYFKVIDKIYRQGTATEHSYRPALVELLHSITGLKITNEEKRKIFGAPDITVRKNEILIGCIEAKDIEIGIYNKKDNEQINRYKEAIGNFILTDYINFQYYKDEKEILTVKAGEIHNGKILENKNNFKELLELIDLFVNYEGTTINKSEQLAIIMAKKTKLLNKIMKKVLDEDKDNNIITQMDIFKEYLIHDLDNDNFSDIYSQAIAYGLFAAKLYNKGDENIKRISVAELIPKSNPFLRMFFHYMIGPDLDENIKWFVDDFAEIFNKVDIEKIKDEFNNKEQDPFVYFYETYLKEYDKETKKDRGVYYTPSSIVKFIVNSIDEVLKNEFELKEGIADKSKISIQVKNDNGIIEEKSYNKVQILDPATGTGTFLAEVIDKIYGVFKNKNKGMWEGYCENDLIDRIYGFEYLMASYTIAHLKIDMKYQETGYYKDNWEDKRIGIYLTNTLEDFDENVKELPVLKWLSDESKAARKIKKNIPVMVVLGNPPYNVKSKNKFEDKIYISYKKEPGGIENIKEKNINNLNDDYVKFIAYGHSLINKYKEGVLAYINNNGFLDNITFYGMRWSILNTFDKIYIINLHGDMKYNLSIEDNEDENVFPIKKGVCINIFIKNNKKKENELATVYYAEIRGDKNKKYEYLLNSDNIYNIKFEKVEIKEPCYFFVNKYDINDKYYDECFGIHEIFNVYSSGTQTGRDHFAINEDKEILMNNINVFLKLDKEKARERFNLGKDTRDWKIDYAKKDLVPNKVNNKNPDFKKIIKYQYRPFDIRYTYFTGKSRGFHRFPGGKIMKHFNLGDNIGLVTCRQLSHNKWEHANITNLVSDITFISSRTKESSYVFPLYIYTFDDNTERNHNLNIDIIKNIENIINLKFVNEKTNDNKTFAPIDIVDYIYAIFYSNKYREKYNKQLLIDFPRIKYPKNVDEFIRVVNLGEKLRNLHLMKNKENNTKINYPVVGNNEIVKIVFKEEKVYINNTQYFEKIDLEIWNYFIGGYRPAYQWLKERKGEKLSYEKIQHYMDIIYILSETINIQKEIDKIMDITNC
jgi:predicted helicase